jgi:hypothetical protein
MRGQKRVEEARERAFARASIENKSASFKKMDCRVKPGNDGRWVSADRR